MEDESLCAFARCEYLCVCMCVWFTYFQLILYSGILVTCVLQSHKCKAAAHSLLLASLCEIYSRETLVEWKMAVIVSVRVSSHSGASVV